MRQEIGHGRYRNVRQSGTVHKALQATNTVEKIEQQESGQILRDGCDLLDNILRRVQVNEALVDPTAMTRCEDGQEM